MIQTDRSGLQNLLTTERQKLPREGRGALTRQADLLEFFRTWTVFTDLLFEKIAGEEHQREDVVEVVGDAPGELADGLHLL